MNLEFGGSARYDADVRHGSSFQLVVVHCIIEDEITRAMIDTAAEWCVIDNELAAQVFGDLSVREGSGRISTRFGTFQGSLERCRVTFPCENGEPIAVDATFFVSSEWPGPNVIGWKGCLERVRFGLDPDENLFYFGACVDAR